ncbi:MULTISPECIES: thioredoxin family protein [Flavobacteriaceae]|jgi:thioredoxin-related protein|uniref:Thioredoxin Disulfide Isomerase n=1 Tax=Leeuwenhoekiella blandensis (strain CECT 7118 / CCUG 51940 / KCTC 22103 / MED217) TaxID=398720 RepID=A3XQN7_LEEBM|nr:MULTISPECIES: thioredoxin family protein [Flavobacteriaceae]EAQ48141.1 Thioredoxin Disulfide Isomerase [Leeuwenhoekiella blandensis MED217]MAO44068.1 thioredoxin family protein [Leeuwenhoekiella sp.]HBT10806.1 thioredoxin family protein [Leeuwenhoekiella sp.]HCW63790.1 thioredoxin family protein [Leeuwenhoekiella sp.]|tara:strand:- start:1354 stop:1797 length:444 start_codon:yes stop_codon:yes gene_type:complete
MFKKIVFTLVVLVFAQQTLHAQNWLTSWSTAKERATTQDKPIILVFQGSDWCAPCIKLDKEIWQSDAFKSYAQKHYVMLQADFPRKKKNALPEAQQKANNTLAEHYNPNGYFPFVVVLDKNGHVLGNTGYEKTTPEAYIKKLNAFVK